MLKFTVFCSVAVVLLIVAADAGLNNNRHGKTSTKKASEHQLNSAPPSRMGHSKELHHQPENRIVGGQESTIEQHPYQVSFVVNNSYFCGGFIISENYIMTAAHCAQDVDPSTVVLRAGSTFRRNGTVISIAEVTPHPDYDDPAFDNDIAVMKTSEPIQFSDTVQAIALPPKGRAMRGGSEIAVSGWGRTQQGASTIPERLMDVNISVVYFRQCQLVYPDVLTHHMFCAGNFFLGGQGTCQGDSGGAATQDGVAVGIVSFGRGCGQPLSPSVFADIAQLRDWVTEQTGL